MSEAGSPVRLFSFKIAVKDATGKKLFVALLFHRFLAEGNARHLLPELGHTGLIGRPADRLLWGKRGCGTATVPTDPARRKRAALSALPATSALKVLSALSVPQLPSPCVLCLLSEPLDGTQIRNSFAQLGPDVVSSVTAGEAATNVRLP